MSARNTDSNWNDVDHHPAWTQSAWRSRVRRNLLAWYDEHARTLPWRDDPTPYKVWVSEIMLQQTQVATVLPYFERFLKAFPNLSALAAADESHLMSMWEGLGYYRRARSLQAAARQMVEQHAGEFPTRFDDVLALPGVGRYTAGAVMSISSDGRYPILEGNTVRVFSRWIAMQTPPQNSRANALLWAVAESMLPRKGSGRFNQAAMELGALVCKPKQPSCDQCPIRSQCHARRQGVELSIPGKVTRTEYESRREFALVIERQHQGHTQYLMRRCHSSGRWAGLWDWPRPTDQEFESVGDVAVHFESQLKRRLDVGMRISTMKHAVTKYRITLDVHRVRLDRPLKRLPNDWAWQTSEDWSSLPMPVTARKIADQLEGERQKELF